MAETLKFTITLPVPKTKDLIPPELKADCEITMDADQDHERIKWMYYKKNYQKLFTKKLEAQIKHMKVPLDSMQKDIDALRANYEKATSSTDMRELLGEIKKAKPLQEKLQKGMQEYKSYLDGMVNNIAKQQSLVWHTTFEMEAQAAAAKKIKSDIFWKKVRHVTGCVILGTLALAAGAAAVAASVATLGAAPAVLGAIGLAVAGIGALSSVYDVGKKIRDTVKMQEASIEKLSKDLAEIATHLGKSGDKTKGLSKHLDDASRFHTQRRTFIAEADKNVKELDQQISTYQANLAKLKLKDEPKAIKKNEKALKELIKTKNETVKEIRNCMKLDEQMNKVFQEARKLVGDLQKIDPLGPRSMADSLKRFTNTAQIKNLAGQLGTISRGAKAIGV